MYFFFLWPVLFASWKVFWKKETNRSNCTSETSLTVGKDGAHFQVRRCETNDGGLVQLRGDGLRKRQQFGQFHKFGVLLFPSSTGGVFRFLFHCWRSERRQRTGQRTGAWRWGHRIGTCRRWRARTLTLWNNNKNLYNLNIQRIYDRFRESFLVWSMTEAYISTYFEKEFIANITSMFASFLRSYVEQGEFCLVIIEWEHSFWASSYFTVFWRNCSDQKRSSTFVYHLLWIKLFPLNPFPESLIPCCRWGTSLLTLNNICEENQQTSRWRKGVFSFQKSNLGLANFFFFFFLLFPNITSNKRTIHSLFLVFTLQQTERGPNK